MKVIQANQTFDIPDNVEITINKRIVTVTGKRGTLVRDFNHLRLDMTVFNDGTQVLVEKWFGTKKELAAIRTVCTHIKNMFIGVTKGFRYKMRFVYAHFPINCAISKGDTHIEIRNFLGEKYNRNVRMVQGVTVKASTKQKDELLIDGNDIEAVSRSAALIHQSTMVRRKDIRKFLDGIYVSEKTNIEAEGE